MGFALLGFCIQHVWCKPRSHLQDRHQRWHLRKLGAAPSVGESLGHMVLPGTAGTRPCAFRRSCDVKRTAENWDTRQEEKVSHAHSALGTALSRPSLGEGDFLGNPSLAPAPARSCPEPAQPSLHRRPRECALPVTD